MARIDPTGFRALVARAGWMTENQARRPRTQPDSRTDSPDSEQDSTADTQTDNPATSTDSARTTPDNGRCAQHPGAPVIGGTCGACTIPPDGPAARRPPMDPVHILGIGAPAADQDAPGDGLREQYAAALAELDCAGLHCPVPGKDHEYWRIWRAQADAVMRVRDHEMEQLRTHASRGADCFLLNHHKRLPDAEATIKRVRRLATDWAILRTHGSAAYELRNTLDEPTAEEPEVVHPGTEQQASEAQQVDEPHPAEAERDQAYRERAHLLAWIAALHPANAVITAAADVDEPGWQLLYLLVGGWQMSWHIAPRDAELFAQVEHVGPDDPRAQWDGHSTPEKYERIQQHVERLAADRP
ncbi:hypothetical protein [Streptomyces antimycoticus]|uniref:hypothetical protein n=1 Tax=Streptomyces antimycoticus TaxID=68175 RepID=UPI00191BC741|nr:hypothetical protein [Streptomyces antimycoticus]